MRNKSLVFRLTLGIATAVILTFVAFVVLFYFHSNIRLKKSLEERAITYRNQVVAKVERQLVMTREITKNVGKQIIFYSQHKHPEELLNSVMAEYPFLNAIHIELDSTVPEIDYRNYLIVRGQDGIQFEQSKEQHFDCVLEKLIRSRMSESNEAGWSEIFICNKSGKRIVSYYMPILTKATHDSEERRLGEVFCELSLDVLNSEIQSLQIDENGFTVLVTNDGSYISHPEQSYLDSMNIQDVSFDVSYNDKDIGISEILKEEVDGSLIAYPDYKGGIKHWAYYSKIQELDWTLFFAIPYKQLFRPLYRTLIQMIIVSLVAILIIFLIVRTITKKILDPLGKVTDELKSFSNEAGEIELRTHDEIKMLGDSLRYMRAWYERFKIRQSVDEQKNLRRMEDLLEASEIQRGLIKTDFSEFNKIREIDFDAIFTPARVISGDLMDYFFLDEDHLLVTIGDVSGKGIPAALFMGVAHAYIKNHAHLKQPEEIVTRVNADLYSNNSNMFFLTLFVGIIHVKSGLFEFCNAAHTSPLILGEDGTLEEISGVNGLPVALYSDKRYHRSSCLLKKGDTIILYTDGITDALDESKEAFGDKRFKENLKNLSEQNPSQILNKIAKSLDLFRGKQQLTDDVTMIALKYYGGSG